MLLLALTALVCAAPCATASSNEPVRVTLQLRWFHQFQFAGYYAAAEQGYYQDAGLDVVIREREIAEDPVRVVLSGQADFGTSNSDILLHRLRGEPVTVLGVLFQHSPLVLVSRKDAGVSTVHDLIGRRVLMSTKTLDMELLAMLRSEGVDLDMLDLRDGFANPGDYLDPELDAVAAYSINQPFYLEQAGIPHTIINPASYGIDFYGDTLFTSERTATERPEVVQAFREASFRGWEYAMRHPQEVADLILAKYGSKKSREHLLYEAERIRALMLPDLIEIGHMNPGRWKHIADTFAGLGMAKRGEGYEGFIFAPEDTRLSGLMDWLYAVSGLLAAALAGSAALGIALLRVRREVRERRKVEERLELSLKELGETKMLMSAVFEQSPVAMLAARAPDMRLRVVNPACRELLGIEDEESYLDRTLPELNKSWLNYDAQGALLGYEDMPLYRSLKGESTNGKEIRIVRKDGSERWVSLYASPLCNEEGEVIAGYLVAPDITEKKRTREYLVQTEKMMSVGGLAAGMAHEINNPLGGVLGGAQNIRNRIFGDLEANRAAARECGVSLDGVRSYLLARKVDVLLEGIRSSGERAATIVRNMLSFSRKSKGVFGEHDLSDLLENTLELASSDYDLKKRYDFRKIEIVRQYDPDVPPVRCEGSEIQQVLLNVLRNGAEAMTEKDYGEGGPRLTLRLGTEEGWAVVQIEDNGTGLSEAARRRVFEPFYTSKDVGQGTGLGLSVSYFIIVDQHSGVMEVHSSPGEWTRFVIKLPLD